MCKGRLRPNQISLNKAAMEYLGNPTTASLTTNGLDLIVLADGPFCFRVAPSGTARLELRGIDVRYLFLPGEYLVTKNRYAQLIGLVFVNGLLATTTQVLNSEGRIRHVKIQRAQS